MTLKISKDTLPIKSMRYSTLGDWWDKKKIGNTIEYHIATMELDNPDYEFLILLHEEIESYLCQKRGIKDKVVTGFDIAHPELNDPGKNKKAPYHKEHMTAEKIEKIMAKALKVNWKAYWKAQDKAIEEYEK